MSQNNQSNNSKQIDKIDAAPASRNESTIVSLARSFNPLGPIAEAYAKTLAYRIECRRLDAEIQRVEAQSKIAHHAIDAQYKLRMQELCNHRAAMENVFRTIDQELRNNHIERMQVLKMAEIAQRKALEPGGTPEEKMLAAQMAQAFVSQIPAFGKNATQNLGEMVKALPPISVPSYRLLSE